MESKNYNRAIRQNAKVYGTWETLQHGSPGFAMSVRKGQRARHDALNYRIDGTRELRPKPLASFFVPAPSLKDFILCFRSENNTSSHSLANNFRRTSDQGTTLSGLFSWSAHRRSSSAVFRAQRQFPPRGRRRTDSPATPSPGRPDRRAGDATVARVRWIPWRGSCRRCAIRHARFSIW
jgi:hypothetical protein